MPQPPRFARRTKALNDKNLTAGARLTYALLDDICWNGEVAISQDALADRLGMPKRNIERHMHDLREAGYIEMTRRRRGAAAISLTWKNCAKGHSRSATSGGLNPPSVADQETHGLGHGPRARGVGNTYNTKTKQEGGRRSWGPVELAFSEWLRDFPGSGKLPGSPDLAVIRACLDLAELDPLREALRQLAITRQEPGRSWMWFPAALASQLGIRRQA